MCDVGHIFATHVGEYSPGPSTAVSHAHSSQPELTKDRDLRKHLGLDRGWVRQVRPDSGQCRRLRRLRTRCRMPRPAGCPRGMAKGWVACATQPFAYAVVVLVLG